MCARAFFLLRTPVSTPKHQTIPALADPLCPSSGALECLAENVYVYVHICIYIYMYMYMYIHIHTYIYI